MSGFESHSTFRRHVWDNPSLCNNCYRQVKEVIPIWKDEYRHSLRMALNDTIQLRTKNGTIGYRREMSADGKASDVFRPTTTCDACGSVGCDSVPDSVSKRELLERLDRIVEWFAEKTDLEPDEEVMRSTVHELKSEEDFQGRDPEILAEAVEMGV